MRPAGRTLPVPRSSPAAARGGYWTRAAFRSVLSTPFLRRNSPSCRLQPGELWGESRWAPLQPPGAVRPRARHCPPAGSRCPRGSRTHGSRAAPAAPPQPPPSSRAAAPLPGDRRRAVTWRRAGGGAPPAGAVPSPLGPGRGTGRCSSGCGPAGRAALPAAGPGAGLTRPGGARRFRSASGCISFRWLP